MVGSVANAQVITQNFGTGANAFSIDFVEIGNPGNVADTSGSPNPVGSVSYVYNLGKYEISRGTIEKANLGGSLGITLYDMTSIGGNGINRPAAGISWFEAAKFVNWLNTSSGYVPAYKFDSNGSFQLWSVADTGYNPNNLFRNNLATYVIPSRDEWYKGAYGSASGLWYNYTTRSDTAPARDIDGTNANTAVYNLPGLIGPSDVNRSGGLSAFRTMGQGGNVVEWNETAFDGVNDSALEFRELRGGSWDNPNVDSLNAQTREWAHPADENYFYTYGFRIAMIPEPSALSLLAIGLGGLAMMCRRRS